MSIAITYFPNLTFKLLIGSPFWDEQLDTSLTSPLYFSFYSNSPLDALYVLDLDTVPPTKQLKLDSLLRRLSGQELLWARHVF